MNDQLGTWSQVEFAGKPAAIFEPHQSMQPQSIVLYLADHDDDSPANDSVLTGELARYGLWAVCPAGQQSWWTDGVWPEFDPEVSPLQYLHEQLLPGISQQCGVEPPNIGLMGCGAGGQGVLQLAYRFAREFPVVAAISPAVDFHNWYGRGYPLDEIYASAESARQSTALLHVNPLAWPRHQLIVCDPADGDWFEGADRLEMKMSSMGIPFEADLTTSEGGRREEYFRAMVPRAVSFLAERLDKERRRL